MKPFGLALVFLCASVLGAQALSGKSNTSNRGLDDVRHGLSGPGSVHQKLHGLPDARELEELLTRETLQDPEDLYRLGLAYESDAFWEPDYTKAFSYFQRSEALGFPYAKAQLGYYYETGLAGLQDYDKAASFYQQGADYGDYWAGLRLGYLYLDGLGVRKHNGQAFFWINWAHEAGVSEATAALGWLHEFGVGTDVDIEEAARLYAGAGDEGMPGGWVLLGLLHEQGALGAKNPEKAVELYLKAAVAGSSQGKQHLGTMFYWGLGVEQDREQAVALFREAAEEGYAYAHVSLGLAYEQGGGVEQDFAAAANHYRIAVEAERIPRALSYLAWLQAEGLGINKDLSAARSLYEEAAEAGDPFAQTELGLSYVDGLSLTGHDADRGRRLLEQAAAQDYVIAIVSLADMYERGIGVAVDSVEAARLYEQAVALGDAGAMSSLGDFYENGTGVERDFDRALELYEKARDLGLATAYLDLAVLHANDAWPNHDYGKAKTYLEKAHSEKVDTAAVVLGIAHFDGDWLDQDLPRARRLFEEAAEEGNWLAAAYLGFMKEEGIGGPKDIHDAVRYYEQGAEGGNSYAAKRLAELFAGGGAISQDRKKALEWQSRAGELGDAEAAYQAAEVLFEDPPFKDPEQASKLYRIAADEGNADASVKWARMQILGEVPDARFDEGLKELEHISTTQPITSLWPLSQLIQDQAAEESHWEQQRERALFQGLAKRSGIVFAKDLEASETHLRQAMDMNGVPFPPAQFALAKLLSETGPDTLETNAEILRLLNLAANRGLLSAQFALGRIYETGRYTGRTYGETDQNKALMWYRLAAQESEVAQYHLANAIARSDPENGLELLEDLAVAGNADAALSLGRFLSQPRDKALFDPVQALFWLEKSARLGQPRAYLEIGRLHDDMLLPGTDLITGFKIIENAAFDGHSVAMSKLAWRYETGSGVEKDITEAEAWYLRALDAGDEVAIVDLSRLYVLEEGFPLEQRSAGAETLIDLVAFGDPAIMVIVANLHIKGELVPRDVAKGVALLEEVSVLDPARGNVNLGYFYFSGDGGTVDYERAFSHYGEAAERGDGAALNALGWMYHQGLHVAQDYGVAAEYYERARTKGSVFATSNLGLLYRDGLGVDRDYEKALELFTWSEERNYPGGAANIGWMLLHGMGMPPDIEKGVSLIEEAALKQDGDGLCYLAYLLEKGTHLAKDLDRAVELYRTAAKNGDVLARAALERLGRSAAPQGE